MVPGDGLGSAIRPSSCLHLGKKGQARLWEQWSCSCAASAGGGGVEPGIEKEGAPACMLPFDTFKLEIQLIKRS